MGGRQSCVKQQQQQQQQSAQKTTQQPEPKKIVTVELSLAQIMARVFGTQYMPGTRFLNGEITEVINANIKSLNLGKTIDALPSPDYIMSHMLTVMSHKYKYHVSELKDIEYGYGKTTHFHNHKFIFSGDITFEVVPEQSRTCGWGEYAEGTPNLIVKVKFCTLQHDGTESRSEPIVWKVHTPASDEPQAPEYNELS